MTDHEIVEIIQVIGKALKAAQDLAEIYRSAWMGQKDLNDELSCDVTRLENERDRLKEKLEKQEEQLTEKADVATSWNGDMTEGTDGLDDSDGYIEDGGGRSANA